MRKTALRSLLILLALTVPVPAAAQDAADKAQAETLFQKGRQLFDAGNAQEACPLLQESQRLEPKLGTLLNLALCHEKLGRTASAWAEFTEAANLAERRNEPERVGFARQHVAELDAKLSTIKLVLAADTPGLTVHLDGKPQARGTLGVALPVDPGKHRVTMSAPGYQDWSTEVDVPPGPAAVPVQLPTLEKAVAPPIPPAAEPAVKPPPTEPLPEKLEEPAPGPHLPIAMTSFSIAGASLVVGIVTGSLSLARTGDLKDECADNVCDTEAERDDLATATALANASNATFVIAGVGALVGLVVLLTAPSAPSAKPAVAIRPVGDLGAALELSF